MGIIRISHIFIKYIRIMFILKLKKEFRIYQTVNSNNNVKDYLFLTFF